MNGASPDPSPPAREPDALARLQLTQALQRAKYAIAWERGWPALARLLCVVGLFLVVSWAGLWLALPFAGRAVGIGLFVLLALAAMFPLVRFRWPSRDDGLEPARSRHRHPPPSGDRADRHAGDRRSGGAGAVAGAARAHAGLAQAHSRRPAVAAAADPRSLGAACAGHGDAGGDLCRRRRRARDARRRRVRLERRAGARQRPGRCLGDAAGLHRQAPRHSFCREPGCRLARQRPVAGSCRQHADRALERRRHRCRGRWRRDRNRAERADAQGHQRAAVHDRRRRHRACPRARRPAAMEVCGHARPRSDHFAGQGSGAPGPRFAADVLQARGRLRRHRSPRAVCATRARCRQGIEQGRRQDRQQGRGQGAAAAVRSAAVCAGAAECAHPQRRRPDREGSQRRPLCRRRRHADTDGEGRGRQRRRAASRSTCGCRSGCSPSRWRGR